MAATLCESLSRWAKECPQKEAYVLRNPPNFGVGRQSITFGELDTGSCMLAQELRALGLNSGDRIVVVGKNCSESVYVMYAALKARLVPLCLHPDRGTPTLLRACANTHCARAFVVHPGDNEEYLQRVEEALAERSGGKSTFEQGREETGQPCCPTIISMTDRTARNLPNVREMMLTTQRGGPSSKSTLQLEAAKPEDVSFCGATSGSTGAPKLVVHTHASTMNFLQMYSEMLTSGQPNLIRYFSDRSFAWYGSCFHLPVLLGATYVCTDPEYTAVMRMTKFVCDIMKEEEISHTMLIPFLLYDIVYNPDGDQRNCLANLETVFVAGERVRRDLLEKATHLVPKLQMLYGSTEGGALLTADVSSSATSDVTHTDVTSDATLLKYTVHPKVELRLFGPDQEGCGEIQIRGPPLFRRYLDNPEATQQAVTSDSWFSTGDVGRVLPDGRVCILGRCKDIISRASRKFYPIEFEELLSQHPKVEKCVVVGVPDPRLYEEICAVVIPREGEVLTVTDLQKNSDSEKFPCKPGYFVFLQKFPLRNDKIDRRGIRDIAVKELGLHDTI